MKQTLYSLIVSSPQSLYIYATVFFCNIHEIPINVRMVKLTTE